MFCRRCGAEMPEDSSFCPRCGTAVETAEAAAAATEPPPAEQSQATPVEPPPIVQPPPETPAGPPPAVQPAPEPAAAVTTPVAGKPGGTVVIPHAVGDLLDSFTSPKRFWSYWRAPALAGVAAIVASYAFALLTMGAVYALLPREDDSPVPLGPIGFILKGAGLLLGSFHGSALRLRGPGAETVRVVAIPLTGLLVVGLVLLVAARWAARHYEGTPRQRMFAGVRTGVPYAIVFTILSTFTTILDGKETKDYFFAELSNRDVFAYGLLWGLLFGAAGGLLATRGASVASSAVDWLDRRVPGARAALAASRRGLSAAALLTVMGLAGAAAVYFALNPDDFGGIFSSLDKSLGTVLALVMFLPNYVVMAFVAAMGGTVVSARTDESLGIFGASENATVDVPAYWWVALLIPLIATVRMGFVAARRSEPRPGDAFKAALLAVIPFAAAVWGLSLLAGVSGFQRVYTSEAPFGFGSSSGAVFFLPVLWGVAGSALGALLYLRRAGLAVTAAPRTSEAPAASGTEPSVVPPPAAAPRPCPSCGQETVPGSRFCETCGTRLDGSG